MSMSADNLVGLRFHEIFYTGFISRWHQQWVYKGSVYLNIQIIGRVITIWDEVFFRLRVSWDGLVIRKKVLSESSHHIDTNIYVVIEVIELHIRVVFKLYLGEEFIEFWRADLRVHLSPISVECPQSNSGYLLLAGTTMIGYWAFGESFCSVTGLYMVIWSIVDVMVGVIAALRYSASFFLLSS